MGGWWADADGGVASKSPLRKSRLTGKIWRSSTVHYFCCCFALCLLIVCLSSFCPRLVTPLNTNLVPLIHQYFKVIYTTQHAHRHIYTETCLLCISPMLMTFLCFANKSESGASRGGGQTGQLHTPSDQLCKPIRPSVFALYDDGK